MKKKVETFSDKIEDFCITFLINYEIHVKMIKFEDFCGDFHRYNGSHTNKILIHLNKEVEILSDN